MKNELIARAFHRQRVKQTLIENSIWGFRILKLELTRFRKRHGMIRSNKDIEMPLYKLLA